MPPRRISSHGRSPIYQDFTQVEDEEVVDLLRRSLPRTEKREPPGEREPRTVPHREEGDAEGGEAPWGS